MSSTRRFSITKAQGDLVKIALANLMDDIKMQRAKNPEYENQYWLWMQEEAKNLKDDLTAYQWYK